MLRDDTVPAPGKAREMHFITGAECENLEPKNASGFLSNESMRRDGCGRFLFVSRYFAWRVKTLLAAFVAARAKPGISRRPRSAVRQSERSVSARDKFFEDASRG